VAACLLVCSSSTKPVSETAGIMTQFLQSGQLRRRASPAIAIQSKNCTVLAAVAVDSGHWTVNVSYATAL